MDSDEQLDLLSRAWCNSAVQVLQPSAGDCASMFKEKQIVAFDKDAAALPLSLQKSDGSLRVDGGDRFKSMPQLNFDDTKSWIWLQKAIHPELDYDLCMRKKWLSKNMIPWKGVSVKKWLKEMKQLRKEEERLKRAQVHAAVSVAGVAAALAAIAAETVEANQHKSLRDEAVASAAALVAAQCAHVAEAAGAKREQISSAINGAVTATDAADIFTLTAAAATSLKGASTLKGRQGHREKAKGNSAALVYDEFGFDYERCRASLAKGDEILVATQDGKRRMRSVSAILNRDGKVILRIKKINILMVFSTGKESVIYELETDPLEEGKMEADGSHCICLLTSQGKIELKIYEYVQYKKWITTINHLLMLSSTCSRQALHPRGTNKSYQNPETC
ncbi:VAN3-binding protein-like isoform X1 [Canna indica]|uniref:VAN3-binding protein-like isoform X1 n=1 Tax=Canna indica TaxID=4628 RepID=A0AAQ3Q512_9LILI|nr:VAN3-binding protein-like isoform X1 [Canna indica]